MAQAAHNIQGSSTTIDAKVVRSRWDGSDADAFRSAWRTRHRPQMGRASRALDELARRLRQEAHEQRQASSAANQPVGVRPWTPRPCPWDGGGRGSHGDPVDTFTGAFWCVVRDQVWGPSGIAIDLARTYRSDDGVARSFGRGWASILDAQLDIGADSIACFTPDGEVTFTLTDGGWAADDDLDAALVEVGGTYLYARSDGRRLAFDRQGRVSTVWGSDGVELRFGHEGRQVLSLRDPLGGGAATIERDGVGRVTGIRDQGQLLASWRYDDDLLVAAMAGSATGAAYGYDDAGRMVEQRDHFGRLVVANRYNASGRVTDQHDRAGRRYAFRWDPETTTATMVDPAGGEWIDRYVDGVLASRTTPAGHTYEIERDGVAATTVRADGSALAVTESGGVVASTAAPGAGPPAPDRPEVEVRTEPTDDGGMVVEEVDPLDGSVVTTEVDAMGRIIRTVTPEGTYGATEEDGRWIAHLGTRQVVVDETDDELVVSDGTSWAVVREDADGVTIVGGDGAEVDRGETSTTRIEPQDGGGTTLEERSRGGQVRAEVDAQRRLTALSTPLGQQLRFSWDDGDQLLSVSDGDRRTSYEYDAYGGLVRRVDPLGRELLLDYDADHVLRSVRTEEGQELIARTDPFGRVVGVTTGDQETTIGRDEAGEVTSIDADGVAVRFHRDHEGRPVAVDDAAGRQDYTWDERGRVVAIRRDGWPTVEYAYDDEDRVVATQVDGHEVTTTYGPGSLPVASDGPGGRVELELIPDGGVLRLPNGVESTATWNDDLELHHRATIDGVALAEERWTRGAGGFHVRAANPAGEETFTHDERGFLVGHASAAGEATWAYDVIGNRLECRGPDGTTTSTIDDRGRLVRLSGPAGERRFAYDDAGRVVADGDTAITYDVFGLTRTVTTPTATTEHLYDAHGRCVQMTTAEGGSVTRDLRIVWDVTVEDPRPLVVTDAVTGRRELHRYDVTGAPMARIDLDDPSRSAWFVTDRLGSVVAWTSPDGTLGGEVSYDPWGQVRAQRGRGDDGLLLLGFQGAVTDRATGHLLLGVRRYDPSTGRFLAPDPVTIPTGTPVVSGYAYAWNRPTELIDPSGRWPKLLDDAVRSVRTISSAAVSTAAGAGGAVLRGVAGAGNRAWDAVSSGASWAYQNVVKPVAGFVWDDIIWPNKFTIGAALLCLVPGVGPGLAFALLAAGGVADGLWDIFREGDLTMGLITIALSPLGGQLLGKLAVRTGLRAAVRRFAIGRFVPFLRRTVLRHTYRFLRRTLPDVPVSRLWPIIREVPGFFLGVVVGGLWDWIRSWTWTMPDGPKQVTPGITGW